MCEWGKAGLCDPCETSWIMSGLVDSGASVIDLILIAHIIQFENIICSVSFGSFLLRCHFVKSLEK